MPGNQNHVTQVAGSVLQNLPQAQENMTKRQKWTVIGFSVLFGTVLYHVGQMSGVAAMMKEATMYNVSWALYFGILAAQCAWLFIMLPGQIKDDKKKI